MFVGGFRNALTCAHAMSTLTGIAEDPHAYAEAWKRKHDRKVIGIIPMNFPADIVHAAGALPVVVQDSREPITEGGACSPSSTAATREASSTRWRRVRSTSSTGSCASITASRCWAPTTAIRFTLPDRPRRRRSSSPRWTSRGADPNIAERVQMLREQIEGFLGVTISPENLSRSIRVFNRNRQLLRRAVRPAPFRPHADHRVGHAGAGQVQHGHGPRRAHRAPDRHRRGRRGRARHAPELVPSISRVTSATRRAPSCST